MKPASRNNVVSRRTALATGVAGAVLTGTSTLIKPALVKPALADGHSKGQFDPNDPISVLRTLHKMRGDEGGKRIAMGWLKGKRYGVVDAEITPLMGMITGTFARHRVLDDGSVNLTSFELAFYTDFDTGELVDRLTIPYTGKSVEVPKLLLGPGASVIKPNFHEVRELRDREIAPDEGEEERSESETAMRPTGSTKFEKWLGPVTVKDDHVWITEASSATRTPADPNLRKVVYSESVTYKASYDDVINPDLTTIESTLGYTGITSWRPWMEMGDHPGHTTSHAMGSKTFDIDGLPDDYRAMSETYYPDAIKDPGAVLDRIS